MGRPLQLDPDRGDIYVVTYAYKGYVQDVDGTRELINYFKDVPEISLVRVRYIQTTNEYNVKVRVVKEIESADELFDVPGFQFKYLRKSESMLDKILSTVIGFFMGG